MSVPEPDSTNFVPYKPLWSGHKNRNTYHLHH